jgi:hypothetical protein
LVTWSKRYSILSKKRRSDASEKKELGKLRVKWRGGRFEVNI